MDRHSSLYVQPWRIDITRRDGATLPLPMTVVAQTAARALSLAGAPSPASVALILSTDPELLELNRRHMGEDHPTDVLSFPLLPPSAFPDHPGKGPDRLAGGGVPFDYRSPISTRRQHIGDLVISVDRAVAQASQGEGGQTSDVAWSAADEMRLLVVHGVLHLCGWDHSEPVENTAMRSLERRILGAENALVEDVRPSWP